MSTVNVIKPNNMFHTPDDWQELQEWIERHSTHERIHLLTAAMMAWNLCIKQMETEQ